MPLQETKLFAVLPDYVSTPDGMAIDAKGRLILSCPNYATEDMSGCVVRIDQDRAITKWFDVPVHPKTGIARNMGIAFDADWNVYLCDNQGWSGSPALQKKGRLLRLKVAEDGTILDTRVVAAGMEHPNGIRIRNGAMYVTQSLLPAVTEEGASMVSCVYRFGLDEENVAVPNTLDDPHVLAKIITKNPKCPYGADGIVFDEAGRLYIGNFGDGEVIRLTLNDAGDQVVTQEHFAGDFSQLESTDGMIFDQHGNLYIADFSANALCQVTPDGVCRRIAQSPDCTGVDGGLDQPGEPIVWEGMLIASCFDLVVGEGKVNLKHEMPATLVCLSLT